MKCDPHDGGCWYCSTDDGEMVFCHEFDTFLHLECLKEELKDADPDNLELQIIAREFGLV
jgi:hypothetical protein